MEVRHSDILQKIREMWRLIYYLWQKIPQNSAGVKLVDDVSSKLKDIERKYALAAITPLAARYTLGSIGEAKYYASVTRSKTIRDITAAAEKLRHIAGSCLAARDHLEIANEQLTRIINKKCGGALSNPTAIISLCAGCDNIMDSSLDGKTVRCSNEHCKMVRKMEMQGHYADVVNNSGASRRGNATERHARQWLDQAQAIEKKEFDEKDENAIRDEITRMDLAPYELSCEKMRAILKEPTVRATKLNNHIPLLIKTFGGPTPPRLTYAEEQEVIALFMRLMQVYEMISEPGNKRYYPYFLYQVLLHIFADNPSKIGILNFIHLQSRETVIKNDGWMQRILATDPTIPIKYKAIDPARFSL